MAAWSYSDPVNVRYTTQLVPVPLNSKISAVFPTFANIS